MHCTADCGLTHYGMTENKPFFFFIMSLEHTHTHIAFALPGPLVEPTKKNLKNPNPKIQVFTH